MVLSFAMYQYIQPQSFVYTYLNGQTVLFLSIRFNVSHFFAQWSNSSIWPIDRTLSVATTQCQRGSGSNNNDGVFCIPQSPKTGDPPSDGLVSKPGHSLRRSYSSVELQSAYSTVPADWAIGHSLAGVLPLCRDAAVLFYCPSRLGYRTLVGGGLTPL